MPVAKRCPFCRKKLDSEGYCRNTECVDYKRTQMHDEEKKKENEGSEGQN